jgi:hypothetical protein
MVRNSCAQNNEPPLAVQRIAIERVHPLGSAIVACQILRGQDGDDAPPRGQRRIHALHEVAISEIPLLENHSALVTVGFNGRADFGRHRHIGGMRPRPNDKKFRQNLRNRVHASLRSSVNTWVKA